MEDLEEAITCHREVITLRPPGDPDRCSSIINICDTLLAGYHSLSTVDDLKQVIVHLSDARNDLPANHPWQTEIKSRLALVNLVDYNASTALEDNQHVVSTAFTLFEEAANHPTATARARFQAALHWRQEARHLKHHSILLAYSKVLTLLDRCLVAIPTTELQQQFLRTNNLVPRYLASDAASSAIDAGQLETAVEFLEQGRAILWSKMRGYRHPLKDLHDVDRQLAEHFQILSGQLESLATFSELERSMSSVDSVRVDTVRSTLFDARVRNHRRLSEEWDSVVERIRQIDQFKDFLQPVPFTTLQSAAKEGPVIIVNISKYRSDAIIICSTGPPSLIPLHHASPEKVTQLSGQLFDALGSNSPKDTLHVLRILWDSIISPVRNQLAESGIAEESRIWWSPTSEFCGLPLHAAGPYARGQKNLPDIYTSSYTTSLLSLIKARTPNVSSDSEPVIPRLLVMGQPGDNLSEIDMLPEVREEIRCIHSLGDFVDVLATGEASRQSVLSQLRQHKWIHFSCHGLMAIKKSSHSNLILDFMTTNG
jgi:CHAT domain-containing protein